MPRMVRGQTGDPRGFQKVRVECENVKDMVEVDASSLCHEERASGEHVVGQWCSWIMMKRWGLLHGMYGSMEAELEVQRTITRAELKWCAETNEYRCMRCGKRQQIREHARKMHRTKISVTKFGKWRKRHLGGDDLVRRMDRQGEVQIWCRKCSGYARLRMGPKLMNC